MADGKSVMFVGGPVDGVRMVLPDPLPREYAVPVMRFPPGAVSLRSDMSDRMAEELHYRRVEYRHQSWMDSAGREYDVYLVWNDPR